MMEWSGRQLIDDINTEHKGFNPSCLMEWSGSII
ncbi:hypothetical protein ZPR_1536 [Zunongwangia profunda SM-A87]|uniref:Uncharacterized protein n=1 Tax=Zunongwangia profunda (strain DSM 18752 / CCTCC AB 206139 / SM-A87) TaxID=655815 RepID=D5BKX2_ZUNPS|nr:hypothetical protein ZPR_1536 [Zunongwangia profunda SM-A87]